MLSNESFLLSNLVRPIIAVTREIFWPRLPRLDCHGEQAAQRKKDARTLAPGT